MGLCSSGNTRQLFRTAHFGTSFRLCWAATRVPRISTRIRQYYSLQGIKGFSVSTNFHRRTMVALDIPGQDRGLSRPSDGSSYWLGGLNDGYQQSFCKTRHTSSIARMSAPNRLACDRHDTAGNDVKWLAHELNGQKLTKQPNRKCGERNRVTGEMLGNVIQV